MKIHLENKHFDFPIAEIFNIFMNYEYIRSIVINILLFYQIYARLLLLVYKR